jgi:acido-empty-quinoprotein group A
MRRIPLILAAAAIAASAQGLDPALLLKPPSDSWPTYNGDYSGRRFSTLDQINAGNVKNLSLAWAYRLNMGQGGGGNSIFGTQVKGSPLLVNGIMYFTVPDHVWAIDPHDGRELWHYKWTTKGGIHIGNRGVGIYGNWLFFETPDNYLVSLDARTGKFRWSVEIADLSQEYFSTSAPVIIRNHVLVGVGGDSLDVQGYLESRDPETGAVQWRWNSTPRPGEPGSETWPNKTAMEHGGGMTWLPGTYDPDLNLYFMGTGNPNPVHAAQSRKGDNLWTCSIVALNPDTGKLQWYFQVSPHDTHDWDAVQTPILIDGTFKGEKRKMLAQAGRNGYFFLLDRTNGKNLLTTPFVKETNWAEGIDRLGRPVPNPAKEPKTDGVLVNPSSDGNTNWPPPSFNPETGLFYVNTQSSFSEYYLTDTDPQPEGYGGRDANLWRKNSLRAIDYQTGTIRWEHEYPQSGGISGLLSTAGKLLFAGDPSRNFIAYDPETGKILWHAGLTGPVSNGAMTFMLDGRQYVVVGAGDMLWAFSLSQ